MDGQQNSGRWCEGWIRQITCIPQYVLQKVVFGYRSLELSSVSFRNDVLVILIHAYYECKVKLSRN